MMDSMMATCPICGKLRVITWPEHWVYRRGPTFYCSENCMIVDITKDMKALNGALGRRRNRLIMDRKITNEMKKKAVEIALSGVSPLAYLRECGAANPSATWLYIRKQLEKKDPETFGKLADKTPAKPPKAEVPTVKVDGPLKIETPEKNRVQVVETPEKPVCTKPLNYSGYDVSAIRRDELGEFYHDVKFNSVDWRTPSGDEVSQNPDVWRKLRDDLPTILKILGVES